MALKSAFASAGHGSVSDERASAVCRKTRRTKTLAPRSRLPADVKKYIESAKVTTNTMSTARITSGETAASPAGHWRHMLVRCGMYHPALHSAHRKPSWPSSQKPPFRHASGGTHCANTRWYRRPVSSENPLSAIGRWSPPRQSASDGHAKHSVPGVADGVK